MRHYTAYNLSVAAREAASAVFGTLSSLGETTLALLMGISVVDYATWTPDPTVHYHQYDKHRVWDLPFALLVLPLLLAGRALNIFPLSVLANQCRHQSRVSCPMQIVMWWSGLRGAVSFALAMTLDDSRESRQVINIQTAVPLVTTTLVAVVASNALLAPFTAPLIRCLRIAENQDKLVDDAPVLELTGPDPAQMGGAACAQMAVETGGTDTANSSAAGTECGGGNGSTGDPLAGAESYAHQLLHQLDERYMKPIFGGRPSQSPLR